MASDEVTDLFDRSGDVCLLRVHVVPGAGRDAVVGRHGDALKVRVRAAAREGMANAAVAEFVANILEVRKSAVELVAGHKSRSKRLRVEMTPEALSAKLKQLLLSAPQRLPNKSDKAETHPRNSH